MGTECAHRPRKAGRVVEELSHQTDHTGHRTVQGSELIRHIALGTVLSRCRNSSDRSHRTPNCPGVGTHQTDHTEHRTVQVSELIRQITQDTVLSSTDRTVPVSDLIRQITLTPYCPSVRPHQTDHIDPVLSQCPTSSDRSR